MEPIEADEVLDQLNKRYNMNIKRKNFRMEGALDTIGEHYVGVSFVSEQFNKEFSFLIKIDLREKKEVV
eukprot:CAMPEP_0176358796 /NCGR_PEP_ID=MMETSP0126-20121128/15835_1 /TAXON_ID=141414 ORGANISM="Strombidinopsis acuminatum, Strain SPMC142" /NCGR_SAMPLE_ID=MMETSP0126 /ASSEMBLY_ACC=CAM_ASM_000229 /LENGTH=68 /DNA_ID=CAMNT_0017713169 /DNA_START=412 /DNA_END=615 /DNA_ORIENTATION=+